MPPPQPPGPVTVLLKILTLVSVVVTAMYNPPA